MSYVLAKIENGDIFAFSKPGKYGIASYKTEAAAKAALTRYTKVFVGLSKYEVMERGHYQLMKDITVKMVERTNLMTGKKYMERADTPLHMSPSSETYWCS